MTCKEGDERRKVFCFDFGWSFFSLNNACLQYLFTDIIPLWIRSIVRSLLSSYHLMTRYFNRLCMETNELDTHEHSICFRTLCHAFLALRNLLFILLAHGLWSLSKQPAGIRFHSSTQFASMASNWMEKLLRVGKRRKTVSISLYLRLLKNRVRRTSWGERAELKAFGESNAKVFSLYFHAVCENTWKSNEFALDGENWIAMKNWVLLSCIERENWFLRKQSFKAVRLYRNFFETEMLNRCSGGVLNFSKLSEWCVWNSLLKSIRSSISFIWNHKWMENFHKWMELGSRDFKF